MRIGRRLLLAVLTFTMLATMCAWSQTPTWTQVPYVNGITWPRFRGWNHMVYDPTQKKSLYFGGTNDNNGAIYFNSLWAFNSTANTWQMLTTSGSNSSLAIHNCPDQSTTPNEPTDREYYAMSTYDTARKRMWAYGGVCDNIDFTDTWYYDSSLNTWLQVFPSANPGSRLESAMVYDPQDDVVILFGGLSGNGGVYNDTWYYSPSANTWTKITTTNSPGPRAGEDMVWDPANKVVVFFGGYHTYYGAALNDVWTYNPVNHTWTQQNPPSSPPGARYPMLAYDSLRSLTTFYSSPGSVWTYSVGGNQWTQISTVGGGPPVISNSQGPEYQTIAWDYDASSDTYVSVDYGGCGGCTPFVWKLKLGSGASAPPPVQITSPATCSVVSGNVTVTANAGASAVSVQFLLDGSNLGSLETSPPYSVPWSSSSATNGIHQLSAKATDASSNSGFATAVPVQVNNNAANPFKCP